MCEKCFTSYVLLLAHANAISLRMETRITKSLASHPLQEPIAAQVLAKPAQTCAQGGCSIAQLLSNLDGCVPSQAQFDQLQLFVGEHGLEMRQHVLCRGD